MAEKDEDEEEREGEAFIVKSFSDWEREKRAGEERKERNKEELGDESNEKRLMKGKGK